LDAAHYRGVVGKLERALHVRDGDWQGTIPIHGAVMSEATFLGALSLICGTVVVLGSLRFFRRYLELKAERQRPIAPHGLSERLDRIESAVESTAIEVERIAEANRFIAKLLAERSGAASLPSRPERVITPH
jgi:hypothetical protein